MDYEYLYYVNILINIIVFVYIILIKCLKKKKACCLLTKKDIPHDIENNIINLISHNVIPNVIEELPNIKSNVIKMVKINVENEL